MTVSVILADDHPLVVAGLRSAIDALEGYEVVAEVSDGIAAIVAIKKHNPDIAIIDIAMPLASGIEVLEEARRWSPETKLIVLTGLTTRNLLRQADRCGAAGIFMKSGDIRTIIAALPLILDGQIIHAQAVDRFLEEVDASRALSARELQILHGVSRGENNAVMAERFGLSPKTVDNHRTNIMRKLGVHSTAELLALALREGLLDQAQHL